MRRKKSYSYHEVRLDALDKTDLPKLRAWRNSPEVYKWCRQIEPISQAHHEAWFVGLENNDTVRMYGIIEGSMLVGVAGFTGINHINRRAEFSLYIGPGYFGRNLGEAGLRALVAHGFSTLGFNSIWGETFEGNAARDIFTRVGFVLDGTNRQSYYRDGKFIDAHIYSILRSEWDKLNG